MRVSDAGTVPSGRAELMEDHGGVGGCLASCIVPEGHGGSEVLVVACRMTKITLARVPR
jgi:hypothetical protein